MVFKVGDQVVLKCGSRTMLIVEVHPHGHIVEFRDYAEVDDLAVVIWHSTDGLPQKTLYPMSALIDAREYLATLGTS